MPLAETHGRSQTMNDVTAVTQKYTQENLQKLHAQIAVLSFYSFQKLPAMQTDVKNNEKQPVSD